MVCYYSPYIDDSSIFSCDNIRIHFELMSRDALTTVSGLLQHYYDVGLLDHVCSTADYKYKHLFFLRCHLSSITFGLSLNGYSSDDELKGFVEFNPNKCFGDVALEGGFMRPLYSPFESFNQYRDGVFDHEREFTAIFNVLFRHSLHWDVKRFDFACDVMTFRKNVQLIKDQRKYSQFIKSVDDYTEYLGSRSSAGFVKVYNKTKESELDYDCTRIEVTTDAIQYERFVEKFPEIYLNHSVSDSDNLLVQLLKQIDAIDFPTYYQKLSLYQRNKLKPLIFEQKFIPSESAFNAVRSVVNTFNNLLAYEA